MSRETDRKVYINDITWMAFASYPHEPMRGGYQEQRVMGMEFVQGLSPITPGYTREGTEMMALLQMIATNPDGHIESMIRWPHPYLIIVKAVDFFRGRAFPIAGDARIHRLSENLFAMAGGAISIASHIYGDNMADYADWMIEQIIDDMIEESENTGEPDAADVVMGALLKGPSASLTDQDLTPSFDDVARQYFKLPKQLIKKMEQPGRIIWASQWVQDETGTDTVWSTYRRTRYPVDRLKPYISPDFEYPFPASEMGANMDGVPGDIVASMATTPDEQAFVQRVDEVVQAVQDSVKAHAGEMAKAAADVTRDVAKDLGYESVPEMLAEGVRGVLKRTKFDRMLDWAHGKVAGLFDRPIETKALPWREKRKKR